ncbi:hypothetical protein CR513_23840, partial [Mucuna pruriens]
MTKSKTPERQPVPREKSKTYKRQLVPKTKSKTHKRQSVPREKSKTHKRQLVPKAKSKTYKSLSLFKLSSPRCDKCQRFTEVGNTPLGQLHAITSPWSFHKWGVDILGPSPPAPGQVKYLIVAVNYFTKWIEAKPIATISAKRIERFY